VAEPMVSVADAIQREGLAFRFAGLPGQAEGSFTNPYLGFAMEVPAATLSQGSTGPCVVMLQQDLNFVIHSGLKVDGDFGPKTLSAVETYQGENRGCTRGVDGIAGHYTMSCLAAGSG
jgi:peptidoglycan hydrolase-like protein with peptidoglycan-binding domain